MDEEPKEEDVPAVDAYPRGVIVAHNVAVLGVMLTVASLIYLEKKASERKS